MHVINNSCFMERVHLEVWTTKRPEYLTLKDECYLFKVGRMSIGCNKIKNRQLEECRWLQWVAVNKQTHVYKWVRSSLLITSFFGILCIQFYVLDNCMLVFFVVGVIMKEMSAAITWFMEIVKSFNKFKASMLLYYGSCFFCYILEWVLWNNCSCFLKFNFGKVLLFLVDYDH